MRLGIVTHNFPAGKHDRQNAGIFVYDLACAVKKLGNEVFVLCPEVGIKKEENEIPVTWFPWAGSSRKMGSLNMLNPKDLLLFLNMAYSGIRVFYGGYVVISGRHIYILGLLDKENSLHTLVAWFRYPCLCQVPFDRSFYEIDLKKSQIFISRRTNTSS